MSLQNTELQIEIIYLLTFVIYLINFFNLNLMNKYRCFNLSLHTITCLLTPMLHSKTSYLCNQCLSPQKLWVSTPFMARCTCTRYNIMFVSDLWYVGGFFSCTPVSSTNKPDRHDIAEILLKVALNTIKQTNKTLHRKLKIEQHEHH
jgi:hypothetical protein